MITKWDKHFMSLALKARDMVKGEDLGVGACVVSPNRKQVSLGYSGLPRGYPDTKDNLRCVKYKDLHLIHAELNAILNACQPLDGWTLYTTKAPCAHCCACIAQVGITRVVSPSIILSSNSRWAESQVAGYNHLIKLGISYHTLDQES